ncbi:hypothetical protein C808_03787 [Lachnospiraceae bacterium M18-1]|nr:hypothetical protein C808_03787 [Lachnospiraceae bacterium M18-1]
MEKFYIQNDGMYLDHETGYGWFVDRNDNVLNQLNLKTREIEYVCRLDADMESPYRRTPFCYKKDHTIIAFPDKGKKICFYDEKEKTIEEYEIKAESNIRLGICCFGGFQEFIWAVSHGLNQIFLVDAGKKRIVRTYEVFRGKKQIQMGYESILNGNKILCISGNSNCVSETDLLDGTETVYELPAAEAGFNTICYDGGQYWLSGMNGNVYRWDHRKNTAEQIYAQNRTMYRSMKIGETICFLPFNLEGDLCNKLLCCNIKEKRCFTIKICEELKSGIYTFEYTKGSSVIGINDSENDFITEINIENGMKDTAYFYASGEYLKKKRYGEVWLKMKCEKRLSESKAQDIGFYLKMIQMGEKNVQIDRIVF